MPRVLRCDEGDLTPETGECAAPYWGQDTGILPPLSAADAYQIATAIAVLWALAFAIRQARNLVLRS